MTDREKAIVMAHTGICMLAGEKFGVFHAYIEDIMGRPVYTHELAIQSISDEIKEKSRDDFIKLCREEQEPCEDAISRQAVLDMMQMRMGGKELYKAVYDLQPVTPQPNIGHWIDDGFYAEGHSHKAFHCSRCGYNVLGFKEDLSNFCPSCGCRMVEPQERSYKE